MISAYLAAQELAATDAKIIDIALKYGYETFEAFSKAFRKQHQFSPSDVRNHVGKIKDFHPTPMCAGTPDLKVYSDGDPHSPDLYSEIRIPVK